MASSQLSEELEKAERTDTRGALGVTFILNSVLPQKSLVFCISHSPSTRRAAQTDLLQRLPPKRFHASCPPCVLELEETKAKACSSFPETVTRHTLMPHGPVLEPGSVLRGV